MFGTHEEARGHNFMMKIITTLSMALLYALCWALIFISRLLKKKFDVKKSVLLQAFSIFAAHFATAFVHDGFFSA
jgi:hypothetical protein